MFGICQGTMSLDCSNKMEKEFLRYGNTLCSSPRWRGGGAGRLGSGGLSWEAVAWPWWPSAGGWPMWVPTLMLLNWHCSVAVLSGEALGCNMHGDVIKDCWHLRCVFLRRLDIGSRWLVIVHHSCRGGTGASRRNSSVEIKSVIGMLMEVPLFGIAMLLVLCR